MKKLLFKVDQQLIDTLQALFQKRRKYELLRCEPTFDLYLSDMKVTSCDLTYDDGRQDNPWISIYVKVLFLGLGFKFERVLLDMPWHRYGWDKKKDAQTN